MVNPADMKRFHLTRTAVASLKSIARYTSKRWGAAKRDAYLKALDKQFHALAAHPKKGIKRDEIVEGLRSYGEASHIIFYFIEEKHIAIVDILHERMEPSVHLTSSF